MTLFVVSTAMAQTGKDARISEIRTAYSQAKKKVEQNGKGGKSPKDMKIILNHLTDENMPLYDEETPRDSCQPQEPTGDVLLYEG